MSRYSIVFWNVQRLFAPGGSPIEHALSLRGGDESRATERDVADKISTIGAVLDRIGELVGPPILVGLAEIENASLAEAIAKSVQSSPLAGVDSKADDQTGFSLDGLNISLLFNTDVFEGVSLLRSHVVDRTFDTRDILEVELRLVGGYGMTTLVNHWPSRLASEAESRRIAAAHYVRGLITSKVRFTIAEMWSSERGHLKVPSRFDLAQRACHPVLVMGDFNDEVFDESLQILNATSDVNAVVNDLTVRGRSKKERFRSYVKSVPRLLNPFWTYAGRGGSYYRSPRWRTYDQILLSRGLVENEVTPFYREGSAWIFDEAKVTRSDNTTVALANRGGKPLKYDPLKRRGCSDHFPVVVNIEL